MMQRREFITLLGGAAATWPLAAGAQQPAMPAVAVLGSGAPNEQLEERLLAALRRGIDEAGYADGRNVVVEFYLADPQRMPSMAAVLVARNVAVIAPSGSLAARSAKAATASIPIVFQIGGDPVALGLVASLSRPGGNATGVSLLNAELEAKRLEILAELIPNASTIAVLLNPSNPTYETKLKELEAASGRLGRHLHILKASNEAEFERAFATMVEERIGALTIAADNFFSSQSSKLAGLAARHAVPSIHAYRDFPAGGGLASYGPDATDTWRQVGVYAGRILKGEKPADLPVLQPTKFEFVLNLKTAKTLNVTIPLPLIGRADEVIE